MKAGFLVPASTTNLGPGFDCLGIALALYNRFEAELAPEWSFSARGIGAHELAGQDRNLVIDAMRTVFSEVGRPELAARISSEIAVPLANGLGSSSTALVGGMLLARELLARQGLAAGPTDERLLELLTQAEGHPDNVAPALMGGFTLCWSADDLRCVSIKPAVGLAAVVVPSRRELATSEARRVLPDTVARADAVYNLSHTALLVAALLDGHPDVLREATTDKLHEPYRATLIKDFAALREALLQVGCDGAFLSGAGPTVAGLVLACDDATALERAQAIAEVFNAGVGATFPDRAEALALAIAREGAMRIDDAALSDD
ncbi:MAG: homoserine kinase [Actinomycetia bacterium]|nr:homoserine kinase [Actinomycetes bacterium]